MIGKVLWFDVKKGFGFIRAENQDYFIHYSKIQSPQGEFRLLEEGELVEFEPFYVDRGPDKKPQAKDVRRIGGNNEILRENESNDLRGHSKCPEGSPIL